MNPVARVRTLAQTTPGLYRLLSLGVAALLVLTAVVATLAANASENASARLRDNTGPVLVATQSLLASLAEADAAATAAFLSGVAEDREQRRLYEEALARANIQSEEISALIGDDAEAHEDLKRLSVSVTRYAGLVEAARASVRGGVEGGEQYLLAALDLLATDVREQAARVTAASERRLDRDESRRSAGVVPAVALGALALGAVIAGAAVVARRSRRIVNPFLVAAALVTTGALGWLVVTQQRAGRDLDTARSDGYESIALTARIQTRAFTSRTEESIALIANDSTRRVRADEEAVVVMDTPITPRDVEAARAGDAVAASGLLVDAAREADSPRERAAVAEMLVRWQRYRDSVADLRGADGATARALAIGPASATFNGFNFSVESVLADNRGQFLAAIDRAADRSIGLSTITLALPLLAALAVLAGFQVRINEYR